MIALGCHDNMSERETARCLGDWERWWPWGGGREEFALGYIWPWMMGCGAYGALEIGLGGGE